VRDHAQWFERGVKQEMSDQAKADKRKRFVDTDAQGNYQFGEGATEPGTIAHTIARSGPTIITSLLGGGAATSAIT